MKEISTAILSLTLTLVVPALLIAAPQTDEAAPGNRFQRKQRPPISLGTSGGNALEFEIDPPFISCVSGTLGALVEKNGVQYVLSNNHVIAMQNQAEVGDPVSHPGLIDADPTCDFSDDDIVADLTGWKKIKFGGSKNNKVDAAIAEARPGLVKSNGEILKIGQPGSDFVVATPGLAVKKAGRTTGLTRGEVVAVGVTGTVDFSAAGAQQQQAAKFIRQIVIQSGGKEIFSSGDSGSVFYEDVKNCPRAVALGFAGTEAGDLALASPMKAVLKAMKRVRPRGTARLVGCEPDASAAFAAAGATIWDERAPQMRQAKRIQNRHEAEILALPEVTAVGIGRSSDDPQELVLKVFLTEAPTADNGRVPERIDGMRTEVVAAGRFVAF